MEINYSLTEDDYLNFNLFHMKNSKSVMNSLKMQRFITPFFFVIISYLFSKISEIPFLFTFIPFLLISVLWIIYYPKFFYKSVMRNAKKMIQEGKNGGLIGKHHMILTEEGIEESTSTGVTKVKWSGIETFKEDINYFYLYNSAVSAYIVPKRDLKDESEAKNFLKKHLNI